MLQNNKQKEIDIISNKRIELNRELEELKTNTSLNLPENEQTQIKGRIKEINIHIPKLEAEKKTRIQIQQKSLKLIKKNHVCKDNDPLPLGITTTAENCLKKCIEQNGDKCNFIMFYNDKWGGSCLWNETCDTIGKYSSSSTDRLDLYYNSDEVSALKFIINKAIYTDKTQQTLEQDIKEYNNSVNQPETSPHMDYLSSFKNSYI